MRELVYDVFARKSRGEALRHIGYLDAPGDDLARVYAWRTYDEEKWFEMCVVRRDALISVHRDDDAASGAPGSGAQGGAGGSDAAGGSAAGGGG